MKFLLFFIPCALFLLFSFSAKSQEIFQPSARSQAMGGIYTPLAGAWAVFGNQSGMSDVRRIVAGGSFQNRFLVNELSAKAGFVIVPVKMSVFGISFYQFGKIPFRNSKLGLAYARNLGPHLSLGAQFNYYTIYLPEENRSATTFGVEIGCRYLPSEKIVAGLHVANPYPATIHLYSGDFTYDPVVSGGLGYKLSDAFSILAEVEKRVAGDWRVKSGFEYAIREVVFIRGGVAGKPYKLSGGAGFYLGKFTVDLAASYDQNLGSSPSISFQYQF